MDIRTTLAELCIPTHDQPCEQDLTILAQFFNKALALAGLYGHNGGEVSCTAPRVYWQTLLRDAELDQQRPRPDKITWRGIEFRPSSRRSPTLVSVSTKSAGLDPA